MVITNFRAFVFVFAVSVLITPCPLFADVIFDNFNGSFITDTSSLFGCAVLGPNISCASTADEAIRLEVNDSTGLLGYSLTSITVPICLYDRLYCLPNPHSSFYVAICTDDNGKPGAALETVLLSQPSTSPSLITAFFVGTTFLSIHTTYWVVMSGYRYSNHAWVYPNPIADAGIRMFRSGTGSWTAVHNDPAVRIEGSPVGAIPTESPTWGKIKSLYTNM